MAMHQAQAYSSIREGIRNHRFRPGQQRTALATAERLGMSPVPVREALMRLFAEEFIEHHTNRGFFVREITIDRLLEDSEVIWLVLRHAVDKALAVEDEQRFEDLLRRLAIADPGRLAGAAPERLAAELEGAYEALMLAVANQRLARLMQRIFDQTHYARIVSFGLRRDRDVYLDRRHRFADALRARDRAAALAVLDQAHAEERAGAVALFREVTYRAQAEPPEGAPEG
jgi:DNA-binding GntR family transcriptional regulator